MDAYQPAEGGRSAVWRAPEHSMGVSGVCIARTRHCRACRAARSIDATSLAGLVDDPRRSIELKLFGRITLSATGVWCELLPFANMTIEQANRISERLV
jgi:hypothetical protein